MRTPRGRAVVDVALAAGCAGVALVVLLSGAEAVPENRDPHLLSILLTLASGLPLAVRRRWPVAVLVVTFAAPFALVLDHAAVGMSTLGPMIAFYTATAHGTARQARQALVVLVGVLALTAVLRPVDLSAEGAVVSLVALTVGWVLGDSTRVRRERHAAEVEALHRRGEELAVHERLRITRELHDVIGHAISVMVVQAEAADRLLGTDPDRAREAIREVTATGRGSLTEMRRLLGLIREGGDAARAREPSPTLGDLPALIARMRDAGPRIDVTGPAPGPPLPPGLELAVYRVVQEALTNCLRHAGASHVTVRLTRSGEALDVEVTDDGRGTSGPPPFGNGLTGMRERAAMYGGDLVAGPAPGGGFRVAARFSASPAPLATPALS